LETAEKLLEAIPFLDVIAKVPRLVLLGKEVAKALERRLGKGWARRLNQMEVYELIEPMPCVFADDLEAALESKGLPTAVISLDTYEALQSHGDVFIKGLAENAPHVLFIIGGLDTFRRIGYRSLGKWRKAQ
jgi:hypothetical protein